MESTQFEVFGRTREQAAERALKLYPSGRIVNYEPVRGGFFRPGGFNAKGFVPTVDMSSYSAILRKKPLSEEEEKRRLEEEKRKLLERSPASKEGLLLREMSERLESLHEKLDSFQQPQEHENIRRIRAILESGTNDFLASYRGKLLERIHKELTLETIGDFERLQRQVVTWIGQSITIYAERPPSERPRVLVLVGPTGAGKTTTIAKLAVQFSTGRLGEPRMKVCLMSIDAFRVAGREQLAKYAEVMGVYFASPQTKEELAQEIALQKGNVDLILVDTIGRSRREHAELGTMQDILEACGKHAEVHLVLPAHTKAADLCDLMKQFEPFGYRAVLVTKLDDTSSTGSVISALAEKGKAVSYITDGQKATEAIHKASVTRLLTNLDGFTFDREAVEKDFGGL